ncbi:aminotransferase class IV [Desulfuribacillus alkaliarsenatis]|uniref:Aminotransferase class IV n=1 Tax=Desulfuribacillus alkaliarsenatis TaxID=766136 RepID=A0A1E5G5M4_9FIRM|nr:aminotransferase class IV [Desulfuribacillus alkaliarsenatis]OEF98463.1 hypothetical protein BHF68_01955 [Desulfuribacillus alkaliarsenatis]
MKNKHDNAYVLINGAILDADAANISIFDGSIQYGFGLFETLRTYDGKFFGWEKHFQRLERSTKVMGISLTLTAEQILDYLQRLRDRYYESGISDDAVYRVTLTPGIIDNWSLAKDTNIIISRRPLAQPLERLQEHGVNTAVLKTQRLPSVTELRIKSTQFSDILFARNELHKLSELNGAPMFEGIMLNSAGYVVEGTITNIFIVIEQNNQLRLVTPSNREQPLLGVTRDCVIDLAKNLTIEVVEESVTLENISTSKEIFLTNSVHGILPVKGVWSQKEPIFQSYAQDWKLTKVLIGAYEALIKHEIALTK